MVYPKVDSSKQTWLPKDTDKWSAHDADNAKVIALVPVWTTHLKVRLNDPRGSFPTQRILWFCGIQQYTARYTSTEEENIALHLGQS